MSDLTNDLEADVQAVNAELASKAARLAFAHDVLDFVKVAGPIAAMLVPGAAPFVAPAVAFLDAADKAAEANVVTVAHIAALAQAGAEVADAAGAPAAVADVVAEIVNGGPKL